MDIGKCTVKGIPLSKALENLCKEFPSSAMSDRDGYAAISYHAYYERFVEVFGKERFSFEYHKTGVDVIGTQHCMSGYGVLTLYDDLHQVVKVQGAESGCSIITTKATGNCVNYANSFKFLGENIFKACCFFLEVGTQQTRALRNKGKTSNTNVSALNETELKKFCITFKQTISSMKGGYKSIVVVNGIDYELIIWKEGVESIEKTLPMAEFVSKTRSGTSFHILGHFNDFKGKTQLVLDKIPREEGI